MKTINSIKPVLAICILLCAHWVFSQTAFLDCSPEPVSRCVNDPGILLPDSNQLLVGVHTPGAVSCGVHVTQTRTITSTCVGSIDYYVALIVDDTVQEILQPLKTVYVNFSNQAVISFDTRTSSSSAIRKNGLLYSEGCNDAHQVRWVVTDKCGNEVVCEERLDLYDCQSPAIVQESPNYLYLPIGCGGISGTAAQLIAEVKDDCLTSTSVLYSFKQEKYRPDTFIYCEEIPVFGVELPWDVFIADQGIDLDCNGEIEWSERKKFKETIPVYLLDTGGSCHCGPGFEQYFVSGKVLTEQGLPIEKVAVNLTAPGQIFPTYVTASNGKLHFNNVYPGYTYTIRPERNDNHRNGVSTLDLIHIKRHLAGTDTFNSRYQYIAADANNSQNVSAIDIVELMKLITGIYSELPANRSWRFVNSKLPFQDDTNPWPFYDQLVLSFNDNIDDADFIGIKIGDVNGSVKAVEIESPFEHARPTMTFVTEQQRFVRGEEIEIPIRIAQDNAVIGFQFTIDSEDLEFLDATPGALTQGSGFGFRSAVISDWDTQEQQLTAIWFDTAEVTYNGTDTLFTIYAKALRDGYLSESLVMNSDITEAEAYDAQEKIYTPVLKVTGGGRQANLLPPSPNPWNQNTTIAFHLEEPADVILSITDVNRNLLWQRRITGHAGRNEVPVMSDEVQGAGMLFCSMQVLQERTPGSGSEVQYQKMMLIK